MAKGDATGGIGVGYNPGGPNIGGSATFGSQRPPVSPMTGMSMIPGQMNPNGPSPTGIGPSLGAIPGMANTLMGQQAGSNNYQPQPMPYRAQGPMIPPNPGQETPGVGPSYNPMEGIRRMINARTQGTPTSPPMQPNNYAINPSANLFNKNQ